jgi:hypothetical protein
MRPIVDIMGKGTIASEKTNLTPVQANYINALAVSVLRLFEPAGPITLGGLFLHWVNLFSRFISLCLM